MTTVAAPAPAAQPLLTYSTARAIAREAEMHRDLQPLDGKAQRASLDLVLGSVGDHPTGHVWGIYFAVRMEQGEPTGFAAIALGDVEDFVATFGGPATHARAAAILHDHDSAPEVEDAVDVALNGWEPEPDFDDRYDGPEWNDRDDRGAF